MLALLLLLTGQVTEPDRSRYPGNLSHELFYEAIEASGSKLCDRTRGKRYAAQFDRRYGKRIGLLVQYHRSRFDLKEEVIVTSDCRANRGSSREQDRAHAEAMDRFETALSRLEQRFGPAD